MEKHKCKVCSRTFNNGRALGGHMKSHLVASQTTRNQLGQFQTDSAASSSTKSPVYGLRENPRKSVRVADPEFSFANPESGSSSAAAAAAAAAAAVLPENPVQIRGAKRMRKKSSLESESQRECWKKGQNPTESPEAVSSVSDTCSEQDLAMCLVMLSRDVWRSKGEAKEVEGLLKPIEEREKCREVFGCSKSCWGSAEMVNATDSEADKRVFKCPLCNKSFMSGGALGSHKRSHIVVSVHEPKQYLIDLNLPPSQDDEVSSVISEI